jgi:serine/threonine protein kinase
MRQAIFSAVLLCCCAYIYLAWYLSTLDPTKYDHPEPNSRGPSKSISDFLRNSKDTKTRNYHPRVVALYDHQYNRVTNRVVSVHTPKHKQWQLELGATNQTNEAAPHLQHNNDTQQQQEEEYVDEDGNVQKFAVQVEDKADSIVRETTSQGASDKCLPMADWQTQSFVNCNSLHEIDLHQGITHVQNGTTQLAFLGQGWFRSTWQVGSDSEEPVVLKTLRLEREFLEEYYELHRRDAVAMERLTHSPFVMNVFGYCGQSALNELANFKYVTSLEALDRRLRGKGMASAVLVLKLRLATSIAVGVSHVHGVEVENSNSGLSFPAGMVHYDLNPRNIAITRGGKPKLNDFNIAEFLKYDPTTNETCGFRSRLHEPWWRAPEEMDMSHQTIVNEKVDIYALGNILFHILTTHSPRGKMKRERMDEVREQVRAGVRPELPREYRKSKDPIVLAFKEVMDMCFEPNPALRATSRQVADRLYETLEEFKDPR